MNNLRETTRNNFDDDENNVVKNVDDFSDDDNVMMEVNDCSHDEFGADEEFLLNKAFDFEGEEISDDLLDDFGDEATCVREQCNELDDEAKSKCRRRCIKMSNMVRVYMYCQLLSFNFFFHF